VWVERFAPAKVNLFLHVGPVAADGYHPVCSLMVFADVGDVVRLRPAPAMAFGLTGPFAEILGSAADNLVVRARDQLIAVSGSVAPFELVLDKRLPIAAGLGGGSADAAAALVLIGEHLAEQGNAVDPRHLASIARTLGADVTACVASKSVIGRGRGDDVEPAPTMPPLDAVLVNPRAPSSTGAVYRAFDTLPAGPGTDEPALPSAFVSVAEMVDFLGETRNDLERPAVAVQPLIGEVLDALTRHPEALFTRMSGSGATCFALCADQVSADRLAARLAADQPGWWVRVCRFGG
jgi:4-diphosphocytidyl-2-C-methyl-D-erythritol kinase